MSLRRPLATALVAAALGAVSVIAFAGCAGASPVVKDYRGEPKGIEAPASSAGGAPWSAWLDGGKRFTLTVYGSSTCPPAASDLVVRSDNRVQVLFPDPPKKPCTKDYVPHTTVFDTPGGIDSSKDVTITAQSIRFTLPALKG